ncbi:uncharacterized protein LOC131858753 [Cryptomeria japonica]|uniref:uncharacterized protein LOC131858753 n=1 Tax=Cryptomeria japonica TaxID=3369 RepID=UPI0027DA21B1|nr:uncharacterized protein LOC131858753 [Cryptomeria japonica]
MEDNQRDWHIKLKSALWADRITHKRSIGNSPYKLAYGKEARLPISTKLPTLDLANSLASFEANDLMEVQYFELLELEESRDIAMKTIEYQKLQMKRVFDKKANPKIFIEGDIVLKWMS